MAFWLKQPYSHRPTSRLILFTTDDFIKHVLSNVDQKKALDPRPSFIGLPSDVSLFWHATNMYPEKVNEFLLSRLFHNPKSHISS